MRFYFRFTICSLVSTLGYYELSSQVLAFTTNARQTAHGRP